MIQEAITQINNANFPKYTFNKIIICGMGASAISGDLIKELLRDCFPIQIHVSREYHLPSYADKETLVICVSYSGNTEETLSQFVDAIKIGCKMFSITSNGKLEEWSDKLEIPYVKAPQGIQPRAAIPYLLIPMILYLENIEYTNFYEVLKESVEVIKNLVDKKKDLDIIAESLLNKQIAIYSSTPFKIVARRMKTQLNENAKIPARFAILPELNHNEIVGYQNDALNNNLSVIILRDNDEPEEIKIRMELTKKLIYKKAKIFEIWSLGKSKLSKTFSLLYKTDYLSIKLAELYGLDAESVPQITFLKKEMRKRLNIVDKLEKELQLLNTNTWNRTQ
jgi:glucose/mannose-6-phosphate isomerase